MTDVQRELAAVARTALKCAAAVLSVYIGTELVLLWMA